MNDRLDRQRWLDAGLERLAAHGAVGVRIMTIAQQLGVTKGSFYWHFKSQGEYLAALLNEWESSRTQHIIDHVEGAGGSAMDKLRRLMAVTVVADPRLAMAVRSWAQLDVTAAKVVKRVDKKRLAYVAGLLAGLGWPPDDAATLARWCHCALIGHFNMQGPGLTEAQSELILGTLAFRRGGVTPRAV